MPTTVDIRLSPEAAQREESIRSTALRAAGISPRTDLDHAVIRRSIDARQKQVWVQLRVALFSREEANPLALPSPNYRSVAGAPEVHIIGAGPAGLFAALRCLELGLKPVVFERGKDVRSRRRDLAAIHKSHVVHPDSNYCFGEGGAGTYSDGKLYTRSKKRGDIRKVLETLVGHGADSTILVDVHPHIGTNKLPGIITDIRETILGQGGEVHFESKVTDFFVDDHRLSGLEINGEQRVQTRHVILATGHSARDIFHRLSDAGVRIEFKPFALGVRAEHPQNLVDAARYHQPHRGEFLPPASYALVHQVKDRGVYSFCMCPGGIIAPCATGQAEVVTNGWSPSKRNNPFANSGIVTEVRWEDIPEYHQLGPLAGIAFQSEVEKACWEAAGKCQAAPAQRLVDFLANRLSENLPSNSYQPGTVPANLNDLLPPFVARSLREAFAAFAKKMVGYDHVDAVLVAPESRTSSPVRIPRDKHTLQHPDITGLFPCGEGAGYAGGIVSAALDGARCVDQIGSMMAAE